MAIYGPLTTLGCGCCGGQCQARPLSSSLSGSLGDTRLSDVLSIAEQAARLTEGQTQAPKQSEWGKWWADNWVPATIIGAIVVTKGPDWLRVFGLARS